MMVANAHIDPTTGREHATSTFWSVQCLRGVAALMIVIGHGQTMVARVGTDPGFHRSTLLPWGASVDLFFVISGFVMVHASRRLFATPGGAGRFLRRRLARIVPLYWLATAAMLLVMAAGTLKGGDRFPSAEAIVASFAFVPFDGWGDGHLFPVVDLGWTLNYEVFFYAVFALFIALPRRRAVAAIAATMAALALVGSVVPPGAAAWFWTRPIILDFVLGLLVAAAVAEGWQLSVATRLGLASAALLVFIADPSHLFAGRLGATVANEWPRVLWAGLPCAALLAAATLGREPPRPRSLAPAAAIGDASYSLYLLHPFALIMLEKCLQKVAVARTLPGGMLVLAVVAAAVVLALVAFRSVERPITAALVRRLGEETKSRRSTTVALESRSA